jgi:hypothetical protein
VVVGAGEVAPVQAETNKMAVRMTSIFAGIWLRYFFYREFVNNHVDFDPYNQ